MNDFSQQIHIFFIQKGRGKCLLNALNACNLFLVTDKIRSES